MHTGRFVPFFEESGLIYKLDQQMWKRACQILAGWKTAGVDLFLSVNISPKDFYFCNVYDEVTTLVSKYGIDPSKLRLEITESVMEHDLQNRLQLIKDFQEAGFLVEMDDFGSGYSSLNMLKDMPVDLLKIDMVFLYDTRDEQRAETILKMVLELSEQLNMPSLTEGVETEEQYKMLVDMGCKLFQGYYFAQPMPLEQFEETYFNAA